MGAMRSFCKRLRKSTGGNAAIIVALGMPVLIGGTGLAVDTAQWYLWKRELQFAVDQAAIAAAWAKAQDEDGTTYLVRGTQEYDASIDITADFDSGPTITLEDYDGGTDNSIQVVASATSTLPFSSILTGSGTTVAVSAQAIYEPGATYKPCLLALDPNASEALWTHGGPTVTAACGIGALSTADDAIAIEGDAGTYDLGYAITAGDVDDSSGHLSNAAVITGATDLEDPWEGLTPPDNSTPRSLSCPTTTASYTADETVTIELSYDYWTGPNTNQLTAYNDYSAPRSSSSTTTTHTDVNYTSLPVDSTTVNYEYIEVAGKGNNKVWEREKNITTSTYFNIVDNNSGSTNMQPGTYSDFKLSCNTTLASGIYVIDGGSLEVASQYSLTGNKVMFVLKNGAGITINGGSTINLTAMEKSDLVALGIPADDAERMAGMLIFEDPDSSGSSDNKINGNSSTAMSGIIYMPNSHLKLTGTNKGVSACLQIASRTLEIGGTADLTTLCPSNVDPTGVISTKNHTVRLIA